MTHISTETLAAGEALETDADAAVSLKGVARRFGDIVAVERLDLDLKVGEFFSIIGPSGCGKTTTLRMVGGFELPSTGKIYLDGRDVTYLPPHKRDINTVFQSYALFPHLTIFDNVAFGLRRKGISRDETRRRVNEHLDLVGLNGFGQRRPAQISGGQQQRVALARALVNHPKVLLLDEPMGALDARIRKTMQVELKRIQREVGITFLYVTHDQAEAMSMSDRLAVMHSGRCEDLGEPQRVYDRPGSRFVANFLGNCNFLDFENDQGKLRLPDGTPVSVDGAVGAASGQLGIRPEKLVMSRTLHSDGATAANRIKATVTQATYLGASSEFQLSTSWGGTLMVFAQNIADSARVRPGEEVEVGWDPSHGFLVPQPATAAA